MSDRLTQLGFYLISRGFISPEHWQLVQHVMIQTLEQNLNQLDPTSQKQFSQEIIQRLYQNSISGWLQIPGHDIDEGLAHRFSVQQLLKLECFPLAFSAENTLAIAVVQFAKPEIKPFIHQIWPQITLKQISISKNQLVVLLMSQRLGKLPQTCDQLRQILSNKTFQNIDAPFVNALVRSGYIANQIYQDPGRPHIEVNKVVE